MSFQIISLDVPKNVREMLPLISSCNSFIAGGAVRAIYNKELFSDFDIFSRTTIAHVALKAALLDKGFKKVYENSTVVRFTLNDFTYVDAVVPRKGKHLLTYGHPETVISHFDFSVCRAAIMNERQAVVSSNFEEDCKKKKLRIEHIVCPLSTVQRIGKYGAKGYKISSNETVKLFQEWTKRIESPKIAELLTKPHLTQDEAIQLQNYVYVD
jgi:hypothetical protein